MQIVLGSIVLAIIFIAAYLVSKVWREHHKLEQLAHTGGGSGLQKAGNRYKEIFDNGSDSIFVVEVRRGGIFVFESLNPLAVLLLGWREIEFIGRSFDELSTQVGDSGLLRFLDGLSLQLHRCIASGLMVECESTVDNTIGGGSKTYHFKLIPMAEDGGITHVICFAQDVSARKLYEQELLERAKLEAQLSRFAASAPGFFYTYRHDVRRGNAMPFASAGIKELFGLQPEDVAESISSMNLRIHPDDMPIMIDGYAKSARDMSQFNAEFRVNHPDSGELWVELNSMPVAEPDGTIVWHGFMHNVTERKHMEEALLRGRRNLQEAQRLGQMGSWELNLVNGELVWSDEMYRIFEIDPAQFGVTYTAFLEGVHPDDRAAVNQAYTESQESRTSYCIDYRLLFSDGRIKHVRECCETHYGEDGKPQHSNGTVQDVTLLKKSERQLSETQKKLRELVVNRESDIEYARRRIAWEMHEELGQLLVAAKMRLYGMRSKLPKGLPSLGEDGNAVIGLLDRSIKSVRDLVSDLRPTVLLHGIEAALEWQSAEFSKLHGIACNLHMAEGGEVVNDELITLVFRITQDLLSELARQNGVSKVIISWTKQTGIYLLTIRHDGEAFAIDQSLSLFSAQERIDAYGGEMNVYHTPEHGSVIEARLPCCEGSKN